MCIVVEMTKYLVCAHTQVQLDLFLRNNAIPADRVRRITSLDTLAGRAPAPLYLLPDWEETVRDARQIFSFWTQHGGRMVTVLEDQVLGKTRFVLQPQDF